MRMVPAAPQLVFESSSYAQTHVWIVADLEPKPTQVFPSSSEVH